MHRPNARADAHIAKSSHPAHIAKSPHPARELHIVNIDQLTATRSSSFEMDRYFEWINQTCCPDTYGFVCTYIGAKWIIPSGSLTIVNRYYQSFSGKLGELFYKLGTAKVSFTKFEVCNLRKSNCLIDLIRFQ